jgi:hypothetical protein
MSTARAKQLDLTTPPVAQTAQTRALIVGVIFTVISIAGAFIAPDQFFRSYLIGYLLWLGVTLGCMAFLMIQHVTGGTWGAVIERLLEAGCAPISLMAILFIPLIFGMKRLYVWMDPAFPAKEEHLQELAHYYLNPTFFIGRAVIYFAVWFLLIYLLRTWSRELDNPPVRELTKLRSLSAPGLLIYALTVSFAIIDWVMSLTPPWISTIYPMIFMVGEALSALCFVIAVAAMLYKYEPMQTLLKREDLADLGKLMLAFTMLWAYFSFSQLLIIWAGNLPEEIPFFTRRFVNGWGEQGIFLALFHFAIPFCLLLSRPFKRNPHKLAFLAIWLIVARFIDIHWYIEPAFHDSFFFHWLDLVVPIAMGGLWIAMFFRYLRARPLLPAYDPRAEILMGAEHD